MLINDTERPAVEAIGLPEDLSVLVGRPVVIRTSFMEIYMTELIGIQFIPSVGSVVSSENGLEVRTCVASEGGGSALPFQFTIQNSALFGTYDNDNFQFPYDDEETPEEPTELLKITIY